MRPFASVNEEKSLQRIGRRAWAMLGMAVQGGYITENNQVDIIASMRRTKKILVLIDYLERPKTGYFKNAFSGEKSGFCPIWISFIGQFLSFIINLRPRFIIRIPSIKLENGPCFQ